MLYQKKEMNNDSLLKKLFDQPYCKKEIKISFADQFKRLEFQRGQTIINPNVFNQSLYFVEDGILRCYLMNAGKTTTRQLYIQGDFITQNGMYLKKPSFEYVECLTHCKLLNINYNQIERFVRKHPDSIKLLLSIIEVQKLKEIEVNDLLHIELSLDRYQHAREILGKNIYELPKEVLASYLRISRKQLGRLLIN